MELLHLLNYQKKDVENVIKKNGWRPEQFVVEVGPSPRATRGGDVSRLEFGEFFFIFDNADSKFSASYSPGNDRVRADNYFTNWKDQLETFDSWLGYLRRELELESDVEHARKFTAAERYKRTIEEKKASDEIATFADLADAINEIDVFDAGLDEPPIKISKTRIPLPHLDALLRLFDNLSTISIDFLLGSDMQQLERIAKETSELNKASLDLPAPMSSEAEFLEEAAENLYASSADFLVRIYTYAKVVGLDRNRESAKITEILQAATKSKVFLERLVKEAQESAQKVTVAKEAKYFSEEANKHRNYSWFWLAATMLLALLTFTEAYNSFIAALESIRGNPDFLTLTNFQSLQFVVSKVILFSFLVGGVFWLGKIYKAHRHNYVVNRHRTNALSCFNVFVDSTSDPQIKNSVLIYAAQCIFAPQATGFNGNESDAGGVSQIVEVVKDLASSSK